MVADGLLHGAFEGLVGGADGQEEVFGAGLTLREESPVRSAHVLDSWRGGGEGVEERDGGRGEEADCRELCSSCGEM